MLTSMAAVCLSCRKNAVCVLLDFGPQPPSNRYERSNAEETETHPLVLGQCQVCGLVQLIAPMAPSMVMARYDWIRYNEPEAHLDELVARLCGLPDMHRGARIVGLTYKDDSTLRRFNQLGYVNTYRYDARRDLALHDPRAGLESIQAALDVPRACRLVGEHGAADLLLARHVLEHAHDAAAFLSALCALVNPGGYLLFEVPDATKFIKACDYSFIWEEHITYFTSDTLTKFMANAGLSPSQTIVYPYPLEDSLIAIVRNISGTTTVHSAATGRDLSLAVGRSFGSRFSDMVDQMHSRLRAWRAAGKRLAVFGAGHLAAKFINFYSLGQFIECVIDDHPHKQGLLMPGSRLPIRGSAALSDIDICLLALNTESERKVLGKYRSFLDRGGQFFSVFALGSKSIYRVKIHEFAQNQ